MREAFTEYPAEDFFQDVEDLIGPVAKEYGFELASREVFDHFDVCEATFRSEFCWMRIGRERGSVFVYIGRGEDDRYAFSYSDILYFLSNASLPAERATGYSPDPDWETPYEARLKEQLCWYRDSLVDHLGEIHPVVCGQSVGSKLAQLAEANQRLG